MPEKSAAPHDRRVQMLPALLSAPALSFDDMAVVLDIPSSTLQKLRSRGEGPKTFVIGRRLYTRQSDFRAWLDRMANSQEAE
jgi:hypothetical protein